MNKRTPRGLNPEERELWERVARSTNPLSAGRPSSETKEFTEFFESKANSPKRIAAFDVGSKAVQKLPSHDLAASIAEQVSASPVAMDKKAFRRLKRGQTKPEARLDLHGMTVSAAHGALTSFIHSAHGSGKRLVLVITGKGRASHDDGPIPARVGVLRHQVPQWLGAPPLSALVLQVTQAHQRHGGGGALYIYLRR